MRIILISREYGLGGTERRLTDLAEELELRNLDVEVYFNRIKWRHTFFNKIRNTTIVRLFYLVFKLYNFRPDIVNTFDLESGIYINIARKMYIGKFIHVSGTGAGRVYNLMTRKILASSYLLADVYVCNSKGASLDLQVLIQGKRQVKRILNGLNPLRLNTQISEEIAFHTIGFNKKTIGYIGKFDDIKHGERMLDMAIIMLNTKRYSDLHFMLIGAGPNRSKLLEAWMLLPDCMKASITILDPIPNAGRISKYFTIGILCSDSEGFPNVLLEYMYFGIPWISTNVGDITEIFSHGNPGIVMNEWDAESFAIQSFNLLDDNLQYSFLSSEGKRIFNDYFQSSRMVDEYIDLYQKCLS